MSDEKRKFAVGDVVRLKSGGPPMTVAQNMDGDAVRVIWFSGVEGLWTQLNNGTSCVFNQEVLEKCKAAAPKPKKGEAHAE